MTIPTAEVPASYSISEVMVCWNRDSADRTHDFKRLTAPGEVCVIAFPDKHGLSAPFDCISGACYSAVGSMSAAKRREFVMALFVMMVERDKVPVNSAVYALGAIREYAEVVGFYGRAQSGETK